MIRISDGQRRARLAQRHRLVPESRSDDPAVIADDLLALHSSDPVTVFLSVCARQADPSIASVEAALYDCRSLLRHHAMRRTIWVMTLPVARRAHASSTRKLAASERRRLVRCLDGDEAWLDGAIEEIAASLRAADGPLTAREIGRRCPRLTRKLVIAPGTRNAREVAAHTRVLQQAGFEARLTRARPLGSWIGSQYHWALASEWAGNGIEVDDLSREDAAADLAGMWLRRFGPALPEDLQWWTGWTKTDTRRALADVGAVPVRLACGEGVASPEDDGPVEDPGAWVSLLPGLDPTAMGWKQRRWYLDEDVAARVTDRFGNIGPTVWADGRIVGGWAQRPDGTVAVETLRPLGSEHRCLLAVESERLRSAVGESRFRPRFPSPDQRSLLG